MTLDPKYMIAPSLQEVFVDKTTGLPLVAGKVYFYSDNSRTTPKSAYKLSGSPPNYTYAVLPNPVTLSAVGTFQDSGSDILPYYYPYDSNGDVELYYIVVTDAGGVTQWTREGWPNVGSVSSDVNGVKNYIPNGQFLLHNNIPADATAGYAAGQIRPAVTSTTLSSGGWTFERPADAAAVDIVTFVRQGSYIVTDPSASPRYVFNVNTQVVGTTATSRALRLKFRDVNKFAGTIPFTLFFCGKSGTGSSANVIVNLVKNFGTTGSATTTTALGTVTLGTTYTNTNISFTFGSNAGKSISGLNDDYVAIDFVFPQAVSNISLIDFVLTDGSVTLTAFPATTYAEFIYRSEAGFLSIPDADGLDLYLPVMSTPSGLSYDRSAVGKVAMTIETTTPIGWLTCDGTQLLRTGYSSDLIPYSRLFDKLWISSLNFPRFGTGDDFFTAIQSPLTDHVGVIVTNKAGAATATAPGVVSPGITFVNWNAGSAGYGVQALFSATSASVIDKLILLNLSTAASFGVNGAGTSTLTVTETARPAGAQTKVTVTSKAATALKVTNVGDNALYFKWSNTTTQYYVWFRVNVGGTYYGVDPHATGTGIQVDLSSVWGVQEVMNAICYVMNGSSVTGCTYPLGSAITSGSYFLLYTTGGTKNYYVWYSTGAASIDPAPVGYTGIRVEVTAAHTAAQVQTATIYAINRMYYKVPDFRGAFIRAWDNGFGADLDALSRYSMNPYIYGDTVGSEQLPDNLLHTHSTTTMFNTTSVGTLTAGGAVPYNTAALSSSGIFESRPYNIYLNYMIKY